MAPFTASRTTQRRNRLQCHLGPFPVVHLGGLVVERQDAGVRRERPRVREPPEFAHLGEEPVRGDLPEPGEPVQEPAVVAPPDSHLICRSSRVMWRSRSSRGLKVRTFIADVDGGERELPREERSSRRKSRSRRRSIVRPVTENASDVSSTSIPSLKSWPWRLRRTSSGDVVGRLLRRTPSNGVVGRMLHLRAVRILTKSDLMRPTSMSLGEVRLCRAEPPHPPDAGRRQVRLGEHLLVEVDSLAGTPWKFVVQSRAVQHGRHETIVTLCEGSRERIRPQSALGDRVLAVSGSRRTSSHDIVGRTSGVLASSP